MPNGAPLILELTQVALIMLAAGLVRATVGFGDALLAMPLLALFLPLQVASPLVGLTGLVLGTVILIEHHGAVDWRAARHLLIGAALGVPGGVLLLRVVPARPIEICLGIVLVGYGLFGLFGPRAPRDLLPGAAAGVATGLFSGVLGGAINTSGPPVVIYTAARAWPPATTRATLQGYFLPSGILIAISHGLGGLWTDRVWVAFAASVPSLGLALLLGGRLRRRLAPERFRGAVHLLLVAMGLLTLFH